VIFDRRLECLGKFLDILQGDVLFRPFNHPDIRPVNACPFSQILL
jgi:hypothetical protein